MDFGEFETTVGTATEGGTGEDETDSDSFRSAGSEDALTGGADDNKEVVIVAADGERAT